MPSGRAHDTITLLLAPLACAAAYLATREPVAAAVVGVAFIFGGVMFGPDLDTVSRQYTRWSILRFIWYPYRVFFSHRSRFTHGLILGALFRVIYFLGIVSAVTIAVAVLVAYSTGKAPNIFESVAAFWRTVGNLSRTFLPSYFLPAVFVGMWLGAASHTFTDLAASYIKTGRIAKFL